MTYVVDTHAIVWYLQNDPQLPRAVAEVLDDPASHLVVPAIVLVELWHLFNRGRIGFGLDRVRKAMTYAPNCHVHPLDERLLDLLPPGLEMHDGIIVATALHYRDRVGVPVRLITRDQRIQQSQLLDVLW